jgi:hypothetical protein
MTDSKKALTEADILAKLREPFPPNQISKLPKPYSKEGRKGNCPECNGYHGLPAVHLDYVGHAAITARLLDADPNWYYEPLAVGPDGLPAFDRNGGLWIRLTVGGMTRLGYGDAPGKSGGNAVKEAIGDALRNAGMRFGMALDLWHKGDLYEAEVEKGKAPETRQNGQQNGARSAEPAPQVDWLAEAQAAKGNRAALQQIWNAARAAHASTALLNQIKSLAQQPQQPPRQRDFISEIDDADGNVDALKSLFDAAMAAGDTEAAGVIKTAADAILGSQA